jgi:hypothetical protein
VGGADRHGACRQIFTETRTRPSANWNRGRMKTTTKLWIGLGVLALLSPLGLYLTDTFKAGSAWGEWSAEEMKNLVGYIPTGLNKLSSLWKGVLPAYAFKGMKNASLGHLSMAYIVSAVVGIALCIGCGLLIGKLLSAKKTKSPISKDRL